jgi:putative membrane protein
MKTKLSIILLIFIFAIGLLIVPRPVTAQGEQGKSLNEIIGEIRQAQGLKPDQQIDCNKVTDQQFEELGEAWMDAAIPDPQHHEMMDGMLGGPGSKSLANAHRRMGAQYLGCIRGGGYGNWMYPGNSGFDGMGGMMYGNGYGHGGWMYSWGGGIFMWIIMIAVIAVVVYIIVAPISSRQNRTQGQQPTESAQEILKKRYAKGEISKEEYERMKKDIS